MAYCEPRPGAFVQHYKHNLEFLFGPVR
jgi:hypothetical protein